MGISRFFSKAKEKLTTPLTLAHGAAYAIYMSEDHSSKMSESNSEEALYRTVILVGSVVVGGLLGYLYQKNKQNKNQNDLSDSPNEELLRLETKQAQSNCWNGTKKAISNFHTGFSRSAGPLSFSFIAFPAMGIKAHREIEPLSMISTLGTIVGAVYSITQACKKAPEEKMRTLSIS